MSQEEMTEWITQQLKLTPEQIEQARLDTIAEELEKERFLKEHAEEINSILNKSA
jgi:hypothetical protein